MSFQFVWNQIYYKEFIKTSLNFLCRRPTTLLTPVYVLWPWSTCWRLISQMMSSVWGRSLDRNSKFSKFISRHISGVIGNDRHSSFLHDNWWLLNYLFDILYMKPMCYHAWDNSIKHICQYFLIKRNRTQPMNIYILQYSQWCVCSYKDQHSIKNSYHESCLKNHMVITPDDYQYCHFMASCFPHIINSRW